MGTVPAARGYCSAGTVPRLGLAEAEKKTQDLITMLVERDCRGIG
jgi:hypothetical protein